LSPDSTRSPLIDDLDFHNRDTSHRLEIEVTLGSLGQELEQEFIDQLEVWDPDKRATVSELDDPGTIDRKNLPFALRLCYRAIWLADSAQAEHWVDFPKTSEPENDYFDRVPYRLRELLPFVSGGPVGSPLTLASRSGFRRLVDREDGNDFATSMSDLSSGLEDLAREFADSTDQLDSAIAKVLDPIRPLLSLQEAPTGDTVQFLPEGGSLTGLLRSLGPALKLGELGHLPLWRHGSTARNLFAVGEVMARVRGRAGVLVLDDFGEHLDMPAARHLAAALRRGADQVWLSSRRSEVTQSFRPSELIRLAFDDQGRRRVFCGENPTSKTQRVSVRYLNLQLLPAMTSRGVVVVEGPHDHASLEALANRLYAEEELPLPAARGVSVIDAGIRGSGGISKVPELTTAAGQLGFHTVGVIDFDHDPEQAANALENVNQSAHAVVRLPAGWAVERLLLDGLSDETIRVALIDLQGAFGTSIPGDLDELKARDLAKVAIKVLKSSGGLHAQFVNVLPRGVFPDMALNLLETCVSLASDRRSEFVQLCSSRT